MRKIIVSDLVTVDGYFCGPNGEIDWHNYDEEMSAHSVSQLRTLGALMFGRTTYDLMAGFWPKPEGLKAEPAVAEMMNAIPKYVFSETMRDVADGPLWKNVAVLHDIKSEEIRELKAQDGGDIAIFGSGTIVQQLTNLGLIDEYRLFVNPLLLANGKPLFKDIRARHDLRLIDTKIFKNGNVLLYYVPK